jgi:hypothetical protein
MAPPNPSDLRLSDPELPPTRVRDPGFQYAHARRD